MTALTISRPRPLGATQVTLNLTIVNEWGREAPVGIEPTNGGFAVLGEPLHEPASLSIL
jgi:hypothetical protein